MRSTRQIQRRTYGRGLSVALVLGLCLGVGSVLGPHFAKPWLAARHGLTLEQPPSAFSEERILLDARSPELSYRAASFGIQPDSEIHRAIMAEQEAILAAYQTAAEQAFANNTSELKQPWRVETFFTQTAKAGPLTSVLRSDYIHRGDNIHRLQFASSMFSELKPEGFDLADIFDLQPGISDRLDELLCRLVSQEKNRRIGRAAINDEPLVCGDDPVVSFLEGPPTVFTPSTRENQFGGLTFYFEPGRIGSDREGEYIIHVPQTTFRAYLAEPYQNFFAGVPPHLE
tara:strand:+ start:18669 stop:19526 length:858 start_codon:yes stop_codon:yes gene_type:complete